MYVISKAHCNLLLDAILGTFFSDLHSSHMYVHMYISVQTAPYYLFVLLYVCS